MQPIQVRVILQGELTKLIQYRLCVSQQNHLSCHFSILDSNIQGGYQINGISFVPIFIGGLNG